jgi:AcrR family transcriptional regulator
MGNRMTGPQRRAQVLKIAAEEFAKRGLHGASTDTIAREAGITQAYIFRMFGTKKALFLELVGGAFDRFIDAMSQAANGTTDIFALTQMGTTYHELLAERTTLLLQLQGYAACADSDVRDLVRSRVARMWETVSNATGLEDVTVKSFLAFGMLLNNTAALDIEDLDVAWAHGLRTRIQSGLFNQITTANNRRPKLKGNTRSRR